MSTARRRTIIAIGVLLLSFLIWLDHSPVIHRRPTSQDKQAVSDFQKYNARTFTVTRVIDGDTIDVDIPDGKYNNTRVRLWGIDTPETKSNKFGIMYFGPEAAEFTRQLALGKRVQIYLDEGNRTRCKYGRLLAYAQLPDGTLVNEVLLSQGYAYADLRFRHSFYHKYQQLEASARRQRKGLWRQVTREQLPEWLQRREPTLLLEK